MKLLTFPIRVLFRLVLLPIKLLLAVAGLTFRTGFRAGTLPIKGGYRTGRMLGLKALVLFAAGIALGVVIGRRLGAAGAELAESYDDPERRGDAGPVVTLVEDTIAVIDTPDGPVVTETLTVSEVDGEDAEEILEVIEEAEAEAELEAIVEELEAEADGPGDADV